MQIRARARRTVVQIGTSDHILFTKGWTPYFETYPGLGVPTPIEIVEHHGDAPLDVICKEIFALTKMNWNSADFCIRRPITLEYASEVGKILAYVPEEVIPYPEYRFYMCCSICARYNVQRNQLLVLVGFWLRKKVGVGINDKSQYREEQNLIWPFLVYPFMGPPIA